MGHHERRGSAARHRRTAGSNRVREQFLLLKARDRAGGKIFGDDLVPLAVCLEGCRRLEQTHVHTPRLSTGCASSQKPRIHWAFGGQKRLPEKFSALSSTAGIFCSKRRNTRGFVTMR